MPRVSDEVLRIMRGLQEERDRAASRLGAALLEMRAMEEMTARAIKSSRDEQIMIGDAELQRLGLDPDAGSYDVDLDTGEVKLNGAVIQDGI